MLNHLSFGVRDLQIAGQFYDAVLASLGFRRVFENIMAIGYGIEDDQDISCLKLSAAERPALPVPTAHHPTTRFRHNRRSLLSNVCRHSTKPIQTNPHALQNEETRRR